MTKGPIDTIVFNELAEATGADFVGELIGAFLQEAPVMITDLKDAAAQDDHDRFRRAAHSIKSNALVFGAHHLGALARNMELSQQAASKTAPTDFAALDAAYAATAAALSDLSDG